MGFRRADGGSITAVTTVTATDTLLVGQGSATRVATMQQVTNAFGFFTQGSASAEIHAIASSLISSQMSAQIAAGDFITSSEASAVLSALASNQISAQVSSQIEAINLSSLVNSQLSAPISVQVANQLSVINLSSMVSAQISALVSIPISVQIANQLSVANISGQISTQSSVQIANQISVLDLITRASASVIIAADVSQQVSAGDFITSSEASAMLADLVSAAGGISQTSVCTLVCGMLSGYITSNAVSSLFSGRDMAIPVFIADVTVQSYPILLKSPRSFIFSSAVAKTSSGQCVFAIVRNGTSATTSVTVTSACATFTISASIGVAHTFFLEITDNSSAKDFFIQFNGEG